MSDPEAKRQKISANRDWVEQSVVGSNFRQLARIREGALIFLDVSSLASAQKYGNDNSPVKMMTLGMVNLVLKANKLTLGIYGTDGLKTKIIGAYAPGQPLEETGPAKWIRTPVSKSANSIKTVQAFADTTLPFGFSMQTPEVATSMKIRGKGYIKDYWGAAGLKYIMGDHLAVSLIRTGKLTAEAAATAAATAAAAAATAAAAAPPLKEESVAAAAAAVKAAIETYAYMGPTVIAEIVKEASEEAEDSYRKAAPTNPAARALALAGALVAGAAASAAALNAFDMNGTAKEEDVYQLVPHILRAGGKVANTDLFPEFLNTTNAAERMATRIVCTWDIGQVLQSRAASDSSRYREANLVELYSPTTIDANLAVETETPPGVLVDVRVNLVL